jgi:hypothetical protein
MEDETLFSLLLDNDNVDIYDNVEPSKRLQFFDCVFIIYNRGVYTLVFLFILRQSWRKRHLNKVPPKGLFFFLGG